MQSKSQDRLTPHAANQIFCALREELAKEVSSSALLAELLERVTLMEKAQATPEEFKQRLYEFVCRAEEQLDLISLFFPALAVFLHPPENGPQARRTDYCNGVQ